LDGVLMCRMLPSHRISHRYWRVGDIPEPPISSPPPTKV
jgi:hypothetical protein